jgi:hypothetical protein
MQCGISQGTLLICDEPNCAPHGSHKECCTPPLASVPKGDWFCRDHQSKKHEVNLNIESTSKFTHCTTTTIYTTTSTTYIIQHCY